MLPFQVKEFTSRSGDEIVLLLDRQDGPAFWPNVFVTSRYVVAGRAADTRKKVLRSIGMARMWAASLARNLDDELSSGHFLSTHQNAPRACLTCRKFEPFRDAPWEQFLEVLKDDLAAESEDRIRLITQEQIEAVREIMAERDASHREAAQ
jgi:hypothetical protein